MDPLARLGAHLAAALQGAGTEADRLLLLHTIADLIAVGAALATAAGILALLARRRDFDFRFLLLAAAAAFLALAAAHGVGLWIEVRPDRWLAAWTGLGAGVMGSAAAILFWMQWPDIVRLPSSRQLRRANAALTRENWDLHHHARQTAEEAQLLRDALSRHAGATALLQPDGRWLHANEALARLLGLPASELLRRTPAELFGTALVEATEAMEGEREMPIAGEKRRLHLQMAPLTDTDGKLRARLLQCRPVDERPADRGLEMAVAEQRRRADDAVALLQQTLAERDQHDAALARRTEQLERSAAQLERLGARISELTGNDRVTGLASSQSLAGRLDLAISLAKRHGQPFSVLAIAADPVDDLAPGSAALLGALGAVLRAELRETDAAARCDEERICVLLPLTRAAEAARVAERVRRRLAATPLAIADGRTLRLSCCVGSAEWKTGQGLGEVLGQAADALRSARGGGRNSVARG